MHDAYGVKLVHGGEDYFARLEKLITHAEHEIHFQTYIFDNDETGKRITAALIKSAQKGVSIYLVVDAYGSKHISGLANQLTAAGVKLRIFGTVYTGRKWAWGRRLHHKIVVIDRCKALVGGINISNHYSGMDGKTPWLDYALLVEGPVCKDIFKVCKQIFTQWYIPQSRRFRLFEKHTPTQHKQQIQLLQNDWLRGKNQIARAYIKAINAAKKEVIIANSYFLPGSRFRKALKNAAKRGVKVKILLAGTSDVPFAKKAIEYLYGYLLRNKIEIYEWQPSVLHAKIACIDGKWCAVGSYNLNFLSAYASIEFDISVIDDAFCTRFSNHLNTMLKQQCVKVVSPALHSLNPLKKFSLWASYILIRLSEGLLTTFPGQRLFNKNRYA